MSRVPAPHHHVKPFSALSDAQMANVVAWTIPRLNSRIQATKEKGFGISHNFGCEIVRLLAECQRRFEDAAPQVGLDIPAVAVSWNLTADNPPKETGWYIGWDKNRNIRTMFFSTTPMKFANGEVRYWSDCWSGPVFWMPLPDEPQHAREKP